MQRCFLSINFCLKETKDNLSNKLKKEFSDLLRKYSINNFELDFIVKDESQVAGRVRVSEVSLNDVFNNISNAKKVFSFKGKNYPVRMSSQRYLMFKENLFCVCCNLKTTRVFLEYHPYDKIPHFNFYGEYNNDLVLMTKDHILAKAAGGEDVYSNYQTMCSTCNSLKSHNNITLQSLKKLRNFYDINKEKFTKKQLHMMIQEFMFSLKYKEKPFKKNLKKNQVVVKNDLFCHKEKKDRFLCVNVLKFSSLNYKKVGSIKKGTILDIIVEYNNKVVCYLNKDQTLLIEKEDLFFNH